MATIKFDWSRETKPENITQATGGAISGEMHVTVDDGLTRNEVLIGLETLRTYLLAADWPAV